jgi:hypothetical protein
MAVPSSGELSLLKIWSEKNEDDYTANNADGENNFSLRGLFVASVVDSSGGDIPLNPSYNNTTGIASPNADESHAMSEFYGYDHDAQNNPRVGYLNLNFTTGTEYSLGIAETYGHQNHSYVKIHTTMSVTFVGTKNSSGISAKEIGSVISNKAFTSTPTAQYNSSTDSLQDTTGCMYTRFKTNITQPVGVSGTSLIVEGTVPLLASNTYVMRAVVLLNDNTIHYPSAYIRNHPPNSGGSFPVNMPYITTYEWTLPAGYTATLTAGTDNYYSTTTYGFSTQYPFSMGSLSTTSFNGSTLTGIYWQDQSSGTDRMYIYFSGSKPSFSSFWINGANLGASSDWTSNGTTSWRKDLSNNPFVNSSNQWVNGATFVIDASY